MIHVLYLDAAFAISVSGDSHYNDAFHQSVEGLSVNTFNGNVFLESRELLLHDSAFNMGFVRYYNSLRATHETVMGYGWRFNYDIRYVVLPDTGGYDDIEILWGDGRYDIFENDQSIFISPAGVDYILEEYMTDHYRLMRDDGLQIYFDEPSHQRVTLILDANGNEINFNYTNGLLTSVVNSNGKGLQFGYDQNDRLSSANLFGSTHQYLFEYDNEANLTKATNPMSGETTYEYDANHRLNRIVDALGRETLLEYYDYPKPVHFIESNGLVKEYYWDYNALMTEVAEYSNDVNCSILRQASYQYSESGKLLEVSDLNGHYTSFDYDTNNRLTHVELPDTTILSYEYNTDGKLTRVQGRDNSIYDFSYDSEGRLTQVTDPANRTTLYQYNASGNLISHNSGDNVTSQLEYSSLGRLTSLNYRGATAMLYQYDAAGNRTQVNDTTYQYNDRGQLEMATDANGNSMSWNYDALGRLTAMVDRSGNTTRYEYDDAGQLTKTFDRTNQITTYLYNNMGNVTRILDPAGGITRYDYDCMGRATLLTDAESNPYLYTYDQLDRLTREEDPNGNAATYTYDMAGNLVGLLDKRGNARTFSYDNYGRLTSDSEGFTYEYDVSGNLIRCTDPLTRQTVYEYDDANRLTKVIQPNNAFRNYSWSDRGQLLGISDAIGTIATYEYDDIGNRTKITDGNNTVTLLEYDGSGNLTKVTDVYNAINRYAYTPNQRISSINDAGGLRTDFQYNGCERLTKLSWADANVVYGYDALGRLTWERLPLNRTRSLEYDETGNLTKCIKSSQEMETYLYDSVGNVTKKLDNTGMETKYWYDAVGNLVKIKDLNLTTTTFLYDDNSRLTRAYEPDVTLRYYYDSVGNMTRINKGGFTTLYFYYDTVGQLTSMTYGSDTDSFEYDLRGRMTQDSRASVYQTYIYNTNNRVVQSYISDSGRMSYDYDRKGNLTYVNDRNYKTTRYNYSPMNLITRITNFENDADDLTYDTHGRLTRIDYSHGIWATFDYDIAGRQTYMRYENLNFDFREYEYGYDNLDRVTYRNECCDEAYYQYDSAGRLTWANIFLLGFDDQYEYDDYGRRTKLTYLVPGGSDIINYAYDSSGRLTTMGTATYEYDDQGCLTKITDGTDETYFSYDLLNRLTAISGPGLSASYNYSATGKIYQHTVNGETLHFQRQFGQVINERNNSGLLLRHYAVAPGGMRLQWDDPIGPIMKLWFAPDLFSSTRNFTGDGEFNSVYDFSPYGRLIVEDEFTDSYTPYLFMGFRRDFGSDFYWDDGRMYHTWSGRFLQPSQRLEMLRRYDLLDNSPLHSRIFGLETPIASAVSGGLNPWKKYSADCENLSDIYRPIRFTVDDLAIRTYPDLRKPSVYQSAPEPIYPAVSRDRISVDLPQRARFEAKTNTTDCLKLTNTKVADAYYQLEYPRPGTLSELARWSSSAKSVNHRKQQLLRQFPLPEPSSGLEEVQWLLSTPDPFLKELDRLAQGYEVPYPDLKSDFSLDKATHINLVAPVKIPLDIEPAVSTLDLTNPEPWYSPLVALPPGTSNQRFVGYSDPWFQSRFDTVGRYWGGNIVSPLGVRTGSGLDSIGQDGYFDIWLPTTAPFDISHFKGANDPFYGNNDGSSARDYSINLSLGWNAITLPADPEQPYIASTLVNDMQAQGLQITHVARWGAGTWNIYSDGLPFNNFDLLLGRGYMLRALNTGEWSFSGYPLSEPVEITIGVGWTFIGVPYSSTAYDAASLTQSMNSAGANVTNVAAWQSGSWLVYQEGLPFNNFTIENSEGYFVRNTSLAVWTP